MLGSDDVIVLPAGVVVREGRLADDVRGSSWPLNPAGAFVLARAGRPLAEVVGDVAAAYRLPLEHARTDVLAFAWYLNRLSLLNVERPHGRIRHAFAWIGVAVRLAPAGALPATTARRRALDTRTPLLAAVTALRAAAGRALALGAAAAAVAAQLSLVAGRPGLLLPAAVGLGTGAALAAHEAAHAVALRGIPSALVVHGRRTYVLHAPAGSRRRRLVALTGPALAALAGALLVTVGLAAGWPLLAVAGAPPAGHALSLTVLGSDGRAACGL